MTESDLIITDVFRTSPATYLKYAAGSMIMTLAVMAAAILAAGLVMWAAVDVRWMLVALIIVMLIFPMTVCYIYFSKLLTTEARRAVTPKHVEIRPGHSVSEIFQPADENIPPVATVVTPWADTLTRTISGGNLIIRIRGRNTPLIIPADAIPPGADINGLLTSVF